MPPRAFHPPHVLYWHSIEPSPPAQFGTLPNGAHVPYRLLAQAVLLPAVLFEDGPPNADIVLPYPLDDEHAEAQRLRIYRVHADTLRYMWGEQPGGILAPAPHDDVLDACRRPYRVRAVRCFPQYDLCAVYVVPTASESLLPEWLCWQPLTGYTSGGWRTPPSMEGITR